MRLVSLVFVVTVLTVFPPAVLPAQTPQPVGPAATTGASPEHDADRVVVRLLSAEPALDSETGLSLVRTEMMVDRGARVWFGLLSEAEMAVLQVNGRKYLVDEEATELWRQKREALGFDAFVKSHERGEFYAELAAHIGPGSEVSRGGGIPGFPCYRTVEEMQSDLSTLASANPSLATWQDWGDSWEREDGGFGYDVGALRITNSASGLSKAPFVIIAATHAREYTTAETATRIAEMLVSGYGVDPEITAVLDNTEIYIVPVHNPDGRKKAEVAATRFWRKNTNAVDGDCSDPDLVGIDLNRNSQQHFGLPGSSGNVCSEIYRGTASSSEPETEAINLLMSSVFTDQRGPAMSDAAPVDATGLFISVHSYGRYILYPWDAFPTTAAPNHADLRSLGRRMGSYVPNYDVCQDCLGGAAGTNVEHAYGEYGVAAYTYELGTSFHQACSTFENTIYPEVSEALLFAAKTARRPYQEPKGPAVMDVSISSDPVPAGTALAITGTADDTQYSFGPFGDMTPEPQQNVTAVYYSIDAPPWTVGALAALDAQDGLFGDELVEPFTGTVDTSGLSAGDHLVYLVAEDASGQRGVATAAWINISDAGLLFADGFESGSTGAWSSSTP